MGGPDDIAPPPQPDQQVELSDAVPNASPSPELVADDRPPKFQVRIMPRGARNWWSRQRDLHTELKMITLPAVFALIGAMAWLLFQFADRMSAGTEARKQIAAAVLDLHRQKVESLQEQQFQVMKEYAAGVTKNMVFLMDIQQKTAFLFSYDEGETLFGLSSAEVMKSLEDTTHRWAIECDHFNAISFTSAASFSPLIATGTPQEQRAAARVVIYVETNRRLFDLYNELGAISFDSEETKQLTRDRVGLFEEILREEHEKALQVGIWDDTPSDDSQEVIDSGMTPLFVRTDRPRYERDIEQLCQQIRAETEQAADEGAKPRYIIDPLAYAIIDEIDSRLETILLDMSIALGARTTRETMLDQSKTESTQGKP